MCKIFLVFQAVLLVKALGLFTGVTQLTSTSAFSNMTFKSSLITQSGTVGYLGVLENGINLIKSYNLSTPQAILISTLDNMGQMINPDKLYIVADKLFAFSPTDLNIFYFNTSTAKLIGNFSLGENINEMTYLPKKKAIVYTTASSVKYFNANLTFPLSKTTIASSIQGPFYISVSPSQAYVAIGRRQSKLYIYSVASRTKVYDFEPGGTALKAITWNPNGTSLFLAPSGQNSLYKIDVPGYKITQSKTSYRPSNTWNPLQMHFQQGTNQLIIVGCYNGTMNNMSVYSWNYTTDKVGYSQNLTFSETLTGVNFDYSDEIYFAANSPNKVYFYGLKGSIDTGSAIGTIPTNVKSNTTANATSNTTTNTINTANTSKTTNSTSTLTNTTIFPLQSNTSSIQNNTNIEESYQSNESGQINHQSKDFENDHNNSQNGTIPSSENSSLIQSQYEIYEQLIQILMDNDLLSILNAVPGGRKLFKPIFAFFVNFDDIWLYVYHPREYDRVVQKVFNLTQTLQSQKWKLVPFTRMWSFIGVDTQSVKQHFNYRLNYTSTKFISIESNSNGFLINSLNLFFANALLTLAVYAFFRILFRLLFNFKVSVLLRSFSFIPVYAIMFLQGNIQYLTFLFSFEVRNLFVFKFMHKVSLGFTLVVYFAIFFFCAGSFLLFKQYYGTLSKYLLDNIQLNCKGILYFSICIGYKNILLGFFHGFFDELYNLKIILLLCIQGSVFILSATLLYDKQFFQYKSKVWILLNTTFIRMVLVFTFFFDNQSDILDREVFQSPHLVLIEMYMAFFLISLVVETIIMLYELKNIFWIGPREKRLNCGIVKTVILKDKQQRNEQTSKDLSIPQKFFNNKSQTNLAQEVHINLEQILKLQIIKKPNLKLRNISTRVQTTKASIFKRKKVMFTFDNIKKTQDPLKIMQSQILQHNQAQSQSIEKLEKTMSDDT